MINTEIPIDEFKVEAEKALANVESRFSELLEETKKLQITCEGYELLNKTMNTLMDQSLDTFKHIDKILREMSLLNYRSKIKEALEITSEIVNANSNEEN